jgi:hypothetical protein
LVLFEQPLQYSSRANGKFAPCTTIGLINQLSSYDAVCLVENFRCEFEINTPDDPRLKWQHTLVGFKVGYDNWDCRFFQSLFESVIPQHNYEI